MTHGCCRVLIMLLFLQLSRTVEAYQVGRIETVAGNRGLVRGLAGKCSLNYPSGVALDEESNLYIADAANHRILRIDKATGIAVTVAGSGKPGFSGDGGLAVEANLNWPTSVAVDMEGSLYIADCANQRVRKVDAISGIIMTIAGGEVSSDGAGDGGRAAECQFRWPWAVALDADDMLFVVDRDNHRVRRITRDGFIYPVAGDGIPGFSGDGGSALSSRLCFPSGIAFDNYGNILIADSGNQRIRRIEKVTGIIRTIAGNGRADNQSRGIFSGDAGRAAAAGLDWPMGVAVQPDDSILVSDFRSHRIRRIDPSTGMISTVVGNGWKDRQGYGRYLEDDCPAASASLNHPTALVIGKSGECYAADTYNNLVRKITWDDDAFLENSLTVFSRIVKPGWNLISFPAIPFETDPLLVFNNIDIANASLHFWSNEPSCGYQSYGNLFGWNGPVVRGQAYWFLHQGKETTLWFEGYMPTDDFRIEIPAHLTAPYWIVFSSSYPVDVLCDTIYFENPQAYPETVNWTEAAIRGLVASTAIGYDSDSNQYFNVGPIYTGAERSCLQPWFGYWLQVNRPGALTIAFTKP